MPFHALIWNQYITLNADIGLLLVGDQTLSEIILTNFRIHVPSLVFPISVGLVKILSTDR